MKKTAPKLNRDSPGRRKKDKGEKTEPTNTACRLNK
jgi:hypothetical protein